VFLACAVEMVEALTIVVAVGFTAGWKSALQARRGTARPCRLVAALGRHWSTSHRRLAGPYRGRAPRVRTAVAAQGGAASGGAEGEARRGRIFQEHISQLEAAGKNEQRVGFVMAFKGVFLEASKW